MDCKRRNTIQVKVGDVIIGAESPISVQTMTKAHPDDVAANLRQIREAAEHGCDIVRMAVPTIKNLQSFGAVVSQSPLPVVADIHFDCRIALGAIKAGAGKIRINPGNMNDWKGLAGVVAAARDSSIPIRIGLNSGSVRHNHPRDSRPVHEVLAEKALEYAARFEDMGFSDIVLSLKSSDVFATIAANRYVAARCNYPLHLGVTAAGPEDESMSRSAIGIGALLADGIGDTIRLSFTGPPVREVIAARNLLRAAGLLRDRPRVISCPTCGRCSVNLQALVQAVRDRIRHVRVPMQVAVMGCEVNGPGEAREADLGIAVAGGRATLFIAGEVQKRLPPEAAVDALVAAVAERAAMEEPLA